MFMEPYMFFSIFAQHFMKSKIYRYLTFRINFVIIDPINLFVQL